MVLRWFPRNSYCDSAYTERYLGMPLENPSGYNVSFKHQFSDLKFLKIYKFLSRNLFLRFWISLVFPGIRRIGGPGMPTLMFTSITTSIFKTQIKNMELVVLLDTEVLKNYKKFRLKNVYGNQDHSMGNRQRHLFMEVGRFLSEECFHRR
uniref:Uncharacterized protein n=1 Tax=Heterorhabditis bacteriophora TaxID=37862 RepID=A0A1I7WA12_HETBA